MFGEKINAGKKPMDELKATVKRFEDAIENLKERDNMISQNLVTELKSIKDLFELEIGVVKSTVKTNKEAYIDTRTKFGFKFDELFEKIEKLENKEIDVEKLMLEIDKRLAVRRSQSLKDFFIKILIAAGGGIAVWFLNKYK